jgi:hypothetical protein
MGWWPSCQPGFADFESGFADTNGGVAAWPGALWATGSYATGGAFYALELVSS